MDSRSTNTQNVPPTLTLTPSASRAYRCRSNISVPVTRSPLSSGPSSPSESPSDTGSISEGGSPRGNPFFSLAATSSSWTAQDLFDIESAANDQELSSGPIMDLPDEILHSTVEVQESGTPGLNQESESQPQGLRPTILLSAQECPICILPHSTGITTSCNHFFCEECITEWLLEAHTCPMCRCEVQEPVWPRRFTSDDPPVLSAVEAMMFNGLSQLEEYPSSREFQLDGDSDEGLGWIPRAGDPEEAFREWNRDLPGEESVQFFTLNVDYVPVEAPSEEDAEWLPRYMMEPEEFREWWWRYIDR